MTEPRQALRQLPLFALLAPADFEAWLAAGETLPIEPGQTIFSINSLGLHIFLILSGKVRVLRPDASGREISLGTLKAGQVFGEYALLPPGFNTATCRAAEHGQVLRLPLPSVREPITALLEGRSRLKDWLRLHYALAALRGQAALGFMSGSSFLPMLSRFEKARFAPGYTIQADGLHEDRFFVIQSGQAQLDGEPPQLLVAGACFGASGLLDGATLPTVTAISDVQCEFLDRAAFELRPGPANTMSVQTVTPADVLAARCHDWVPQREENDCGVAVLAMATRALGRNITPETLRKQIPLQQRGASLLDLQRVANQKGFRAQAVRVAFDHLRAVRMPALCHLSDEHYVVLLELAGSNVIVGDPARGITQWTLATLQARWSGQLLLLSTNDGTGAPG